MEGCSKDGGKVSQNSVIAQALNVSTVDQEICLVEILVFLNCAVV